MLQFLTRDSLCSYCPAIKTKWNKWAHSLFHIGSVRSQQTDKHGVSFYTFHYTFHYTSGMAGCCSDSFSRFLLECGTLFNGRKKCTWGAGMNFPKEKDFSERLKFMGSSFSLKESVISYSFLWQDGSRKDLLSLLSWYARISFRKHCIKGNI